MAFKKFALNVLTLGGHDQLEAAKADYHVAYNTYEQNRCNFEALESTKNARLCELGNMVASSFDTAKKARRMLGYANRRHVLSQMAPGHIGAEATQNVTLIKIDRVIAEYSSSVAAVGGVGAGAAVAAGSWSLVTLVGSASTGTAISALSGVAATNATLAWFGGGALAAGGAGMAGGTLVLGGLALAPVLAIAAWHSRSKTREINQETDKVRLANQQVLQATSSLREALDLIVACRIAVQPSVEILQREFASVKSALFPTWAWSLVRRWSRRLMGRPFYADEECALLDDLELALGEFVDRFRGLPNR